MAREVCIKIKGSTHCTGSPIEDCSCERDGDFEDPFPEVPVRLEDAKSLVRDLETVLATWEKLRENEGIADKFYAIAAITRLILLPQVSLAGPFVITSMDPASEEIKRH
jgi:hypothetical protein